MLETTDCFHLHQRNSALLSFIINMRNTDDFTITHLLKSCAETTDFHQASRLHACVLEKGFLGKCPFIASALIIMYARCGVLAKARQVLDQLPIRDVIAWNALISGYSQRGEGNEALDCFERMQKEGVSPGRITYTSVLRACGSIKAIEKGKQIHDEIVQRGLLQNNIELGNALVDMYVKCGLIVKAQEVLEELPLRDVVSWSSLIAGYVQEGESHKAILCIDKMQREGIAPNDVTFMSILKACGCIGAGDIGKKIHDEIVSHGFLEKNIMLGTSLVNMYAKCGDLMKAQQVLKELPFRNVVSWNALISGYAENRQSSRALNLFRQMQREGISPNNVTFLCILKACRDTHAVEIVRQIHKDILSMGFVTNDIVLATALVDMYAKCGAFAEAHKLLEALPIRDVVSWNALIAGYAQTEQDHEALNCFAQMQREGLSANEITFTCVLKACSSIGAIEKGKQIHDEIVERNLLEKNIVLATALVDMYAKCGLLSKAHCVLEGLPLRDIPSWNALIGGYAQQGRGYEAFGCIAQLENEGLFPDAVTFLCALNACVHSGKLGDAQTYYENMCTKYGVAPKLEHHTCIVMLSAFTGCFDKALSVIKSMPSLDNDTSVWHVFLTACKNLGNVELALLAFDKLL